MELFGNTTGLPPSATKVLERIYRRRVPLHQIVTRELAQALCDASRETGRQVGALVHRSGEVDYVVVGDAGRLFLPDVGRLRAASGRFRGLRLIHTHLRNEPLSHDDLVDLVRLRLDLVVVIQLAADGQPTSISYAHNVPPTNGQDVLPYREVGPVKLDRLDVDFGSMIAELEGDFAEHARTHTVGAKDGRAILVHVGEKGAKEAASGRFATRTSAETSVRELSELARTAGVEVADVIVQMREKLDPKYVLGRGKLDEVVVRAMQLDAETLIFDRELSPTQSAAIAAVTDLKILDRSQLILDIFAQRAESRDGKLQVELAQLKYTLPYLGLKDDALSRLTGGIGGRGPGETKLEIGKRRARERVHHLEQQIDVLSRQRRERRRQRGKSEVPVIAIVGYTNAGKSTLLNTLTGSDVLAENKLFATLDTRARRVRLVTPTGDKLPNIDGTSELDGIDTEPKGYEAIIVDTVGFIRGLPEDLFNAFRATFEEAADADLLIHVVDASDPARDEHIRTTMQVLQELKLDGRRRLLVYNKVDLLPAGEADRIVLGRKDSFAVSAFSREGGKLLLAAISKALATQTAEVKEHSTAGAFMVDGFVISPARGSEW